ncbi:hypothetical protein [Umezawaea sp.]|uniref:hypothetical protein n=1 Tax=Umezawaea sp. TaxID=1955258 RepID=UPI002ED266AC
MTGGYEVVDDDLTGHARTLDGVGDDLEAALSAVERVNLTADAYGAVGRRFVPVAEQVAAAWCDAVRTSVVELLQAAKDVRGTVTTHQRDDGSGAARFGDDPPAVTS